MSIFVNAYLFCFEMTTLPGLTIQELLPSTTSRVTLHLYNGYILSITHSNPPPAVLTDLSNKTPAIIVPNCGLDATYDEESKLVLVLKKGGKVVERYGKRSLKDRFRINFVSQRIIAVAKGVIVIIGKKGEIGYLDGNIVRKAKQSIEGTISGLWSGGDNGGALWISATAGNNAQHLYKVKLVRGEDRENEKENNQGNGQENSKATEAVVEKLPMQPSIGPILSVCEVGESLAILDSNCTVSILRLPSASIHSQRKIRSTQSSPGVNGGLARLSGKYFLACYGSTASIWDSTFGVCHAGSIGLGGAIQSLSSFWSSSAALDYRVCASISGRGVVSIQCDQKIRETSLANAMEATLHSTTIGTTPSSTSNLLNGLMLNVQSAISSSAQAASVGSSFNDMAAEAVDTNKQRVSEILQSLSSMGDTDALETVQGVMATGGSGCPFSEQVTAAIVARSLLGIQEASKEKGNQIVIREWCKIVSKCIKTRGVSSTSVTNAVKRMRSVQGSVSSQNTIVDVLTQDIGREIVIENVLNAVGDLLAKDYVRIAQYALHCNHNHLMERTIAERLGKEELMQAIKATPMRDVWRILRWCLSKLNIQEGRGMESKSLWRQEDTYKSRRRRKPSLASLEAGVITWVECLIDAHFSSLVVNDDHNLGGHKDLVAVFRTVRHLRKMYEQATSLLGPVTHVEEHGGMPEGSFDANYSVERLRVPLSYVQS